MLNKTQGLDIKVGLAMKYCTQGHYSFCTNNVTLLLKTHLKTLFTKQHFLFHRSSI